MCTRWAPLAKSLEFRQSWLTDPVSGMIDEGTAVFPSSFFAVVAEVTGKNNRAVDGVESTARWRLSGLMVLGGGGTVDICSRRRKW